MKILFIMSIIIAISCGQKDKGYPTQMHKEAIIEFGLSKIHRKSFKMK